MMGLRHEPQDPHAGAHVLIGRERLGLGWSGGSLMFIPVFMLRPGPALRPREPPGCSILFAVLGFSRRDEILELESHHWGKLMRRALIFGLTLLAAWPIFAKPLSVEQKQAVDAAVSRILKASEVPSASIAIVTDGKIDYAQAYGDQRLNGSLATTSARYPVASISKQFTAAAILLLVEDGKMSLDDKVAKYFPTLSGANTVTIRELLSHTSGYRDYWPQDFQFEAMTRPTTPEAIMDRWAKAPLDYAPGSKWQYSNTGYVVAGRIFERVAKEPLQSFEQRRLFKPLGMNVVLATTGLSQADARGTTRYALGPVRPGPNESDGWVFAAGDLAMTPSDLAKLEHCAAQPCNFKARELAGSGNQRRPG